MKKLFIISILIPILSGCVSDEANRLYIENPLSPKSVEDVDVLWKAPDIEYTVIADFQAKGASIKYVRKRAAEIGADAVIVVLAGGNYSYSEVWAGKDSMSNTYSRIIGTAIIYNELQNKEE
jgi:hypothetical protein